VGRADDELWVFDVFNRQDIVRQIRYMESRTNFRSQSVYNNVVYSLAGHVIETLGGGDQSWETLMRDRLLGPLNMTGTTFYHDRDESALFARPHILFGGQSTAYDTSILEKGVSSIASSVSICSTPGDMSIWMRALLDSLRDPGCVIPPTGGRTECTAPVVPRRVLRDTVRPQVVATPMFVSELRRPVAAEPLIIDGYGLGWFTGHYRGYDVVMHYGSLIGYYSMITIIAELNLGIFTSYNGAVQNDPYTLNSLLHVYLIDAHLGLKPWINLDDDGSGSAANRTSSWCHFQPDYDLSEAAATAGHEPPPSPTDAGFGGGIRLLRARSAYVGEFYHSVLGPLHVFDPVGPSTAGRQTSSSLMARYGALQLALVPQSETSFLGVPVNRTWLSILGNVHVVFSDFAGDDIGDGRQKTSPKYRRVSVRLISTDLVPFERRGIRSEAANLRRSGSSGAGGQATAAISTYCSRWATVLILLLVHCKLVTMLTSNKVFC
jgi:hypothetical protein